MKRGELMGIESFIASLVPYLVIAKEYIINVWYRFIELVYSPMHYPEMIWILVPLVLTILLMEFYFGRYKFEELGWNTAFANSLVLIFVSIDLVRHLYNSNQLFGVKLALVAGVILLGILLVFFDFFHLAPKWLAFSFSSKLPVNFVALVAVFLVYTEIVVDTVTGGAIILMLIVFYLLIVLVHNLIPGSLGDLEEEAPKPR